MPTKPEDPMNTHREIEQLLRERHHPALPGHFVLPAYEGHSIANIGPTVARILGVREGAASPTLPRSLWESLAADASSVILLVLDAVGYRQLDRFLRTEESAFSRLRDAGTLIPLTSVFPSTTVSGLTSIWTGQPPLGHGFLGTRLLLPRQGLLANLLRMAPAAYGGGGRLQDWGWDADDFVTVPSIAGRLSDAGVGTVMHTRRAFLGSPLTRIFLRGMEELVGYVGLPDLWLNLRRTLRQRRPGERLFVGVYWSGIDAVGHAYGPESNYPPAALHDLARSLSEDFLNRISPPSRAGTLLLVTADHGQISTPPERVVHLPAHPELWDALLLPPAGESRASYVYVKPGQRERVLGYVASHLADRFVAVETEEALEAGLWGSTAQITPELRARLGDIVILATGDSRLSTRPERKDDGDSGGLRGHHGSLTADEMLVPLLMTRLDAL